MKYAFALGEIGSLLAVLIVLPASGGNWGHPTILAAWITLWLCGIGRAQCEANELADRQVDLLERIAERLGEPIQREPQPAPKTRRPPPVPLR